MIETKGSAETRELMKNLLTRYSSRTTLAEASHYSFSYIYYLSKGERIASKPFCDWVKTAHPDFKDLCNAVLLSKIMD